MNEKSLKLIDPADKPASPVLSIPKLSPAEAAEAARFWTLTAKKANLQAAVRRLAERLAQSTEAS